MPTARRTAMRGFSRLRNVWLSVSHRLQLKRVEKPRCRPILLVSGIPKLEGSSNVARTLTAESKRVEMTWGRPTATDEV